MAHRHGDRVMPHYVGLDVSQRTTSICVVDGTGRHLWRGSCRSEPEGIFGALAQHAGTNSRIGIETGPMTPWLVHALRERGLEVVCLDARHARAVLKMQLNKTDANDAEGLAQIVRTGWHRAVHVKSLEAHRTRWRCQSKIEYSTRMTDSIFAAIDFPRFIGSDRGGSTAISGIQNFALAMPPRAASERGGCPA